MTDRVALYVIKAIDRYIKDSSRQSLRITDEKYRLAARLCLVVSGQRLSVIDFNSDDGLQALIAIADTVLSKNQPSKLVVHTLDYDWRFVLQAVARILDQQLQTST